MNVIVSLTSIRSRVEAVAETVQSLLRQDLQPTAIELYVSEEPYLKDKGYPRGLLESTLSPSGGHVDRRIEIEYVANTGPYRKLIPSLRKHWKQDVVIVTCDDDTVYPEKWLSTLCGVAANHPEAIVAYRCSHLRIENGVPAPYREWAKENSNPEIDVRFRNLFTFPTGKDGVLYRPSFFDERIFDERLLECAPTNDDLVFKLATLLTRTPVIAIAHRLTGEDVQQFKEVPGLNDTLWSVNCHNNDSMLKELLSYAKDHYGFEIRDFLATTHQLTV